MRAKVIKVYQKECASCGHYKAQMERLEEYAMNNGQVVQVIRTPLSESFYKEAAVWKLPQPFCVIDNKAYPLGKLPGDKE